MEQRDRHRGCLLGLAVGDAVGTTVEFLPRGTFEPLTDMVGGGPFKLLPGQWTDDTSMALCLATSLVECGEFDAADQVSRYCRWLEEGYLSSTGRCFDIGRTVLTALHRHRRDGTTFAGSADPRSAGNGSIMRLAPIPMAYFRDIGRAEWFAAESSRTTHAATECLDACRLLARMACRALVGQSKDEVLFGDATTFAGAPAVTAIARGEWRDKTDAGIVGSGYVVESLEAALWAFHRTTTYSDAILAAANLGQDADTTAAVCGQLAGAHYGEAGIPRRWVDRLALRDDIIALADALADHPSRS